jgi:hypothetical protein
LAALGLVLAGVLTFWSVTTGSAQNSPLITVRTPPGGFNLPPKPKPVKTSPNGPATTVAPSSTPTNRIVLAFTGTVSCSSPTCTALATIYAPVLGTRTNVVLATFAQVLSSGQSKQLSFGLSQHSVNLLYNTTGDPRCTVVITVVNGSAAASTSSVQVQAKTITNVPINIG